MKLIKQNYYTAQGEKKINTYKVAVPKVIVEESGITDKDEIYAYAEKGKIIIEKVKKR